MEITKESEEGSLLACKPMESLVAVRGRR